MVHSAGQEQGSANVSSATKRKLFTENAGPRLGPHVTSSPQSKKKKTDGEKGTWQRYFINLMTEYTDILLPQDQSPTEHLVEYLAEIICFLHNFVFSIISLMRKLNYYEKKHQ